MNDERLEFNYSGTEQVRLDKVIHEEISQQTELEDVSRSQIKLWISGGRVSVDGETLTKAGALVKPGSKLTVLPLLESPYEIEPYDFELDVLYEDSSLIVINKPAGLTMHPGAGNRHETLVNALYARTPEIKNVENETFRPGIVHRLDKDTTGVVVIAKTTSAHNVLSAQFADRSVDRKYLALVLTTPRARREINSNDSGVIDAAIGRCPQNRVKMAVREEGGRSAVTNWQVRERMDYGTLLEVKLQSGRTHQIRVHMDSIASPVIGDRVYGNFAALPKKLEIASQKFGRQALHAYRLEFEHPVSKERMLFEAALPEDFEELLEVFRGNC